MEERCSAICARWREISSSIAATRSRSPEPARTGRAGTRAGVRLGAAARSGRASAARFSAKAMVWDCGGRVRSYRRPKPPPCAWRRSLEAGTVVHRTNAIPAPPFRRRLCGCSAERTARCGQPRLQACVRCAVCGACSAERTARGGQPRWRCVAARCSPFALRHAAVC